MKIRGDFFLCTNWLAESARAWVSNTRWKIDEQWDCWTLCAKKNEGKNRGGEGTTPVTTACPEAGKEKCAKKRKKKKVLGALRTRRRKRKKKGFTLHALRSVSLDFKLFLTMFRRLFLVLISVYDSLWPLRINKLYLSVSRMKNQHVTLGVHWSTDLMSSLGMYSSVSVMTETDGLMRRQHAHACPWRDALTTLYGRGWGDTKAAP